jgi:medium-chain acyl-[acyl-carrier-protein] hydrolase
MNYTIPKSCVRIFKPNPDATIRLFCFPHSGGAASAFRTWPEAVPSRVEICAIELPGRGTNFRDIPFENIEPLIDTLYSELILYGDKPFVFFGHSLGALLAYELTRKLMEKSQSCPQHLFLSAHRAPHMPHNRKVLYNLNDDDLIAEIKALNGIPKELLNDPELLSIFLPVIRADLSVCETYTYTESPPLPVPFTVCGGRSDPRVPPNELIHWNELTSRHFDSQLYPGGHFYIESNRDALLENILEAIR